MQFTTSPFNYGSFIIYPLFILLLPINTTRSLVIITAFLLGLSVDIFYDSPGVHASACVFTSYLRAFVLKILAPVEGYKHMDGSPSVFNVGFIWFATYSSILVFLHLLFYFSVDAFTFVYFIEILLKTVVSFLFSIGLYILHQLIFRTK